MMIEFLSGFAVGAVSAGLFVHLWRAPDVAAVAVMPQAPGTPAVGEHWQFGVDEVVIESVNGRTVSYRHLHSPNVCSMSPAWLFTSIYKVRP
jgi:predicted metal-dependent RNase